MTRLPGTSRIATSRPSRSPGRGWRRMPSTVYREPSFRSERLGMLKRDEIISIQEEITASNGPSYNPLWYRLAQGFVHSGYLQRLDGAHNNLQPLSSVAKTGQLAEVTVPVTRQLPPGRQAALDAAVYAVLPVCALDHRSRRRVGRRPLVPPHRRCEPCADLCACGAPAPHRRGRDQPAGARCAGGRKAYRDFDRETTPDRLRRRPGGVPGERLHRHAE